MAATIREVQARLERAIQDRNESATEVVTTVATAGAGKAFAKAAEVYDNPLSMFDRNAARAQNQLHKVQDTTNALKKTIQTKLDNLSKVAPKAVDFTRSGSRALEQLFDGLESLKNSMRQLGGIVDNGPVAQKFLQQADKGAAFIGKADGSFVIRVLPDATVREVAHEVGHAVVFKALGPKNYGKLSSELREYLAIQYALNQQTVGKLSIIGRGTETSRLGSLGINRIDDLDQFISGGNQDTITNNILSLLKAWGAGL